MLCIIIKYLWQMPGTQFNTNKAEKWKLNWKQRKPIDTGRKLNVLCKFNLRPASTGKTPAIWDLDCLREKNWIASIFFQKIGSRDDSSVTLENLNIVTKQNCKCSFLYHSKSSLFRFHFSCGMVICYWLQQPPMWLKLWKCIPE